MLGIFFTWKKLVKLHQHIMQMMCNTESTKPRSPLTLTRGASSYEDQPEGATSYEKSTYGIYIKKFFYL